MGKVISFKVNDLQFLEFVEDKDAREKPRLVSVSFETEDVGQMRESLQVKLQPSLFLVGDMQETIYTLNG